MTEYNQTPRGARGARGCGGIVASCKIVARKKKTENLGVRVASPCPFTGPHAASTKVTKKFFEQFVHDYQSQARFPQFVTNVVALVKSFVEGGVKYAVKEQCFYAKPAAGGRVWSIHLLLRSRLAGEVATRSRLGARGGCGCGCDTAAELWWRCCCYYCGVCGDAQMLLLLLLL